MEPHVQEAIQELLNYDKDETSIVFEKERADLRKINITLNKFDTVAEDKRPPKEKSGLVERSRSASLNDAERKADRDRVVKEKDKITFMKEIENKISKFTDSKGSPKKEDSKEDKKEDKKEDSKEEIEMKTIRRQEGKKRRSFLSSSKRKKNSHLDEGIKTSPNISGRRTTQSLKTYPHTGDTSITIAETVMMNSFSISKATGKRTTQTMRRDQQLLERVDTLRRDFASFNTLGVSAEIPVNWKVSTPRSHSRYKLKENEVGSTGEAPDGKSHEVWMTDWVTKLTHQRLEEVAGISTILLQRVTSGNISSLILKDLPLLHLTILKLTNILKSGDTLKQISDKVCAAVMQSGFRHGDLSVVSDPSVYAQLPVQLISVYLKSCEVAIEELRNKELVRYLDGSIKEKVALWWLNLIQFEVDNFLAQLGYNFSVVPQDYTTQPPKDLPAVKANLRLVEDCLDPVRDSHNVMQLITELKAKIYPIIDDFVYEALIVLSDCILTSPCGKNINTNTKNENNNHTDNDATKNTDVSSVDDKTNTNTPNGSNHVHEDKNAPSTSDEENIVLDLDQIDVLLTRLANLKEKDDDVVNELCALAKDVRYLYRMRELEDATKATAKLMDAVPVTGLILARLCTLENELKTVIELWEYRMLAAKEETHSEGSGMPERTESGTLTDTERTVKSNEMKRAVSYKGHKTHSEDGGTKMLLEGGVLARHGKNTFTTPVLLQVNHTTDCILLKNPETRALVKEFPLDSTVQVHAGKNGHFHFYAAERHCFSLQSDGKYQLNLETKTGLERDKWVAAFRWLLATKEIIANSEKKP